MKQSLKLIAVMVVGSLLVIFAYQAYWLTGLYGTMKQGAEQNIYDALRTADYNELMLRVERLQAAHTTHGQVEVTAGYLPDDSAAYVMSQTTIRGNVLRTDSDKVALSHSTAKAPSAALQTTQGLDVLLTRQRNMQLLATYFQRGIHSGLDLIADPDVAVYDSLLTALLTEKQLDLPHRLEYLHSWTTADSILHTDTLAAFGTVGYIPTKDAKRYEYSFDIHGRYAYRLTLEPLSPYVWRQMSGILLTSLVILIIIGVTFALLIRTIMQQKTLDELKTDFTHNITHELKTPIAVAYAANDALLNFNLAENKPQRDNYLRICQAQLQRLSGLVEQILSMSMEQRKTFKLQPETLSLREVLPPLIEQHKLKAGKPVEIMLTVVPDHLSIVADRTHLGNILSNLIDNAIKYSPERADITINCRRATDGTVSISIADCGIGIPADKLPHIFDKFYRVPTGNVHDVKGYGLGLYYVKTMVEKHGWSIMVKSEAGRGSQFSILIGKSKNSNV
ncbi:MAG: HAMP domain-containing histidine kinase [Prevotellaceae bacterium]|nr:HAMP domain-containing histidine kinase [Prevotellaceae bacterium]